MVILAARTHIKKAKLSKYTLEETMTTILILVLLFLLLGGGYYGFRRR